MWLHFHMKKLEFDWSVEGSDIDEASVKKAELGVYHKRDLETAPRFLCEGLWLRGKEEISDWFKVRPELSQKTNFRVQNLFDLHLEKKFHVIFCRNVLMYFDKANQEKVVLTLKGSLLPGGLLVIGLSESLPEIQNLHKVGPSIYKSDG